MFNYLMEKL